MKDPFVRPKRGAPARSVALLALGLALPAVSAWGAGFEKATNWSGKYVGVGGAAIATAAGSDALYFNPAGLVGPERTQISMSVSPTFAKLTGPMPSGQTASQLTVKGNQKFSPVAATTASYPLGSRWSAGLGFYVAGGMKAFYEDVSYKSLASWATLTPTVKVDLAITEVALGTAYQLAPGWKVGGSWRVVNVGADFSTAKLTRIAGVPVALQNVSFNGMTDTKYNGMRLGLQYQDPEDKWGFGATWRNEVKFDASGDTAGKFQQAGGAITTMAPGTASIKNTLPQQFALGFYYRETPQLKLLAEYAWTEYSVNQILDVTGGVNGVADSLDTAGDVIENWGNMSNIRVGAEYTGLGAWALRAGYVHTSRVTPSDYARATFSVPGEGNTVTLGAGRTMSDKLDLDAALEYSFASGRGGNIVDGIANASFRSTALVVHTGATYRF